MSRHGFIDCFDYDEDTNLAIGRWQGRVASAIRGKRGQAFLRDMVAALDAMQVKELHPHNVSGSCVCAMGAVGAYRGVDLSKAQDELDDECGDHEWATEYTGGMLDIAAALAREIAYENDEGAWSGETPAQRWARMRVWASRRVANIDTKEPAD